MEFRVEPFRNFEDIVRRFLEVDEKGWSPPRQLTYLRSYLANFEAKVRGARAVAPARSIVVEQPYTDRHYLEEYTAYYATLLEPPSQSTTRLHFFQDEPDSLDLTRILENAAAGGAKARCEELAKSYIGCVTLRPIRNAPIGRTLLKPYQGDSSRTYRTVLRNCGVRLAGLELGIHALPFFQQDQGVGACATAAVWSALSKACRDVGMRSPTPFSVTRAATSSILNDRRLPATGLDLSQMAAAIHAHGLEPLLLKVGRSPEHFLWSLKTNLQSGIPAILFFKGREEHAVAISGYKTDPGEFIELAGPPGRREEVVRTGGMKYLYVHDDRIGPYVKMGVKQVEIKLAFPDATVGEHAQDGEIDAVLAAEDIADALENGKKPEKESSHELELIRLTSGSDPADEQDQDFFSDSRIRYAIFPTYPKMRMGAVELGDVAGKLLPLVRILGSGSPEEVSVDGWFEQNGSYLDRLFTMGANPKRVAQFAQRLRLSRYVGVLRWKFKDAVFADVVCDTTDVPRGDYSFVRGMFVFDDGVANSPTYDSYRSAFPRAVLS